jgi:hypothetical protein
MSYRDPAYTYRCAGACRQRLDFDEHRPLEVNGLNVCSQCCDMCNFCLEWLDDETCKIYGAAVKTVLPETEHQYTVGHAHCMGQWILGCMAGIPNFDVDDYTKQELAAIYAGTGVAA